MNHSIDTIHHATYSDRFKVVRDITFNPKMATWKRMLSTDEAVCIYLIRLISCAL